MQAVMHSGHQPHLIRGPKPHNGMRNNLIPFEQNRKTILDFYKLPLAPTLFFPNMTTTPNHKDKIKPLDHSFIWGCEWILLQQGDWEGNCITAGHLGSLLESVPSFPVFWPEQQKALNGNWKSWVHTQTCTQPRVHSPQREGRMEWHEASCCAQAYHLLLRTCPGGEVTEGNRPWVLEEGGGNNHCQVSVVEFLAQIWLIYHWQQKPPSGTIAAVSSLPDL